MIPENYQEWRHCITVKCGIPLTLSYIGSRLEALKSDSSPEATKFQKLYGEGHFNQIVDWFTRALKEASDGKKAGKNLD